MLLTDPMLVLTAALALVLAFVNGLHDASNAVATTVATRALSERAALIMAALLNLIGALLGIGLITWTAAPALELLGMEQLQGHLTGTVDVTAVVVSALVATIIWNTVTWWWGMPSSTWHALFSAVAGGALALSVSVPWADELMLVAGSTLLAPALGVVLAYLLVHGISRLTLRTELTAHHLRVAQTVSAGAVAAGHGLRDATLPMAAVTIVVAAAAAPEPAAQAAAGAGSGSLVPWWLAVGIALAMAAGTLAGGRRIIRTLARRLADLSSAQGLAAETAAALILFTSALGLGGPVSTSHTVTAGIVGSGLAVGRRSVRWSVAGQILTTWLATPVATAAMGALGTVLIASL